MTEKKKSMDCEVYHYHKALLKLFIIGKQI